MNWNFILKFVNLPDKWEGTISDLALKLNFSSSTGYFYRSIFPVLKNNNILVFTGRWKKKRILGRYGKIYKFNKLNFYKFLVENNKTFSTIFKDVVNNYILDLPI